MGKTSKGMVRWQLLIMPTTHVVLSGRYLKVGKAFPNLIFVRIWVRERRRKLGERELHLKNKRLVNYLFFCLF